MFSNSIPGGWQSQEWPHRRSMSQRSCHETKRNKIIRLKKMPRSFDRGTFAGSGNNCREGMSGRGRRRRVKHQRKTVHAVAKSGRFRAVVEDVAEMAAAAAAMHLGAHHAEGAVRGRADRIVQRLPEARPAGAALILGLGREQRQVAAGAGEGALAVLLEQRARSRPLGALVAQDLVLLRRQLRAPFGVGLLDLEFLGGLRRRGAQPAKGGKAEQAGDGSKQDAAIDHQSSPVRTAQEGVPEVRQQIRTPPADVTSARRRSAHFLARRPDTAPRLPRSTSARAAAPAAPPTGAGGGLRVPWFPP